MQKIRQYLAELYPSKASEIRDHLLERIESYSKVEPIFTNPTWYKNINMYVVYPDAFKSNKQPAFVSLTKHIVRIKELGCTAIHVLPFLESPMLDKGFDISDFRKLRPALGNLNDLKFFKKSADEAGIRVFMDLVFNHVSDKHEWFKKAENGDEKYRDYFIHTKEKPIFIRTYHQDAAVWAEYKVDGQTKAINVAFPEQTGEIPHWRQGKDGFWYYHTYYPEQPDINWQNPDVFLECAEIVMYWASLGFHFRLDAIPFIGKSAYKEIDKDHEKTFAILSALKLVARAINPECAVIVETYESIETVIEYFGNTNREQAELSYNFHVCTNLWVTLIQKDTSYLWNKLNQMLSIPNRCEWLYFLRNHDELSLAYLNEDLKNRLSEKLDARGASFREGYGISGRTYSLLGSDERRFLMAYFLLASLGSSLVLPYGDELGKKNIPLSKLSKTDQRDTRNINRGPLTRYDFTQPKAKRIAQKMQEILRRRQEVFSHYINSDPIEIKTKHKPIFAAQFEVGNSQLLVFVNLSDKPAKVSYNLESMQKIFSLHEVHLAENHLHLGGYAGVWLQR